MFKLEGGRTAENSVFDKKTLKAVFSLPQLTGWLGQALPGEGPLSPRPRLASVQVKVVDKIKNVSPLCQLR